MHDLRLRSVSIILENQHASGAYVASPNFSNYRYSWLRDGSFIAYAMLREGQIESAARFLGWVNSVINSQYSRIQNIVAAKNGGTSTDRHDYLPTRYHLDGTISDDDWPNFQIDGYGAWLWLLAEYVRAVGDETIIRRFRTSIRLTLDYLAVVWQRPNYDCWEEFGDAVHPSTLACVYGGVNSINKYLGEKALSLFADQIRSEISALTVDGRFSKNSRSTSIEASLLGLSIPFGVVLPHDERMRRTVRLIEEELLEEGGVRRYPDDTYYGGGLWILLGCWLGWYYVRTGKREKAELIARWVECQADTDGNLPEQVPGNRTIDTYHNEWMERWGAVATPLLWSHAMYLVLEREISEN